jgi:hypothetical protein
LVPINPLPEIGEKLYSKISKLLKRLYKRATINFCPTSKVLEIFGAKKSQP